CNAATPMLRVSQVTNVNAAGTVMSARLDTADSPIAEVNSLAATLVARIVWTSSAGASIDSGSPPSDVGGAVGPPDRPPPTLTGTPATTGRLGSASRASR